MATGNVNPSTISQLHDVHQIQMVTSASMHLLANTGEAREKYLNLCVPLYKLALRGDWKTAKSILSEDQTMLNASITEGWETVLHVAAGANHVHFVKELVKLMDVEDLALKNYNGDTAFCLAAAVGNVGMAEIMWQKNPYLPTIRGGAGVTPLYMSILQGEQKMAWYLYPKTTELLEERDWNMLFFTCIKTGLYDLALKLVEDNISCLALARDDNNETALHVLARKPTRKNNWMRFDQALQLVRCLWNYIIRQDNSDFREVISRPSHLLFTAAEEGNFEFLAELINSYPPLIWEVDNKNRRIIHIGILHRHTDIFNLIHQFGILKQVVAKSIDVDDQNNLLHLVAKLAPTDRLNVVSGAALQMQLELLWFEAVKEIMLPSFLEMKNSNGITPRELFTIEHEELLSKAESWMKNTANSCMVVSTLIIAGVLSVAVSIPGGSNDKGGGTPNYLLNPVFLVFVISNAITLISSLTSIQMFLSIRISSCAEDDFFKSLPMKLMIGLVALFISITSMMVAFSSVFFITYYHRLKWVPTCIAVLAFVPVPLFLVLHYPLWTDITYTNYHCRSLFRPNVYMLN